MRQILQRVFNDVPDFWQADVIAMQEVAYIPEILELLAALEFKVIYVDQDSQGQIITYSRGQKYFREERRSGLAFLIRPGVEVEEIILKPARAGFYNEQAWRGRSQTYFAGYNSTLILKVHKYNADQPIYIATRHQSAPSNPRWRQIENIDIPKKVVYDVQNGCLLGEIWVMQDANFYGKGVDTLRAKNGPAIRYGVVPVGFWKPIWFNLLNKLGLGTPNLNFQEMHELRQLLEKYNMKLLYPTDSEGRNTPTFVGNTRLSSALAQILNATLDVCITNAETAVIRTIPNVVYFPGKGKFAISDHLGITNAPVGI